MHSMATDRRHFLASVTGALLALLTRPARAKAPRTIWLSANAGAARQYALGAFDPGGEQVFEIDLPGRGHGIAVAPNRRTCVAIARRPGTFAAVVDLASGKATGWLEAPSGRHFHGHAAFSQDGRLLFTSENDFANRRGVIGIWDAGAGYRRLNEIDAHAIEPHDLHLLSDGRTLIVADGGIRTHPDSERARLNLDDMDSALLRIDLHTGALLGRWKLSPGLQLLSIRHLAISPKGDVAIGMQHQTDDVVVPVVGLQRPGEDIALLAMPPAIFASLRNYCGSIAMDRDGGVFAASCPRGNTVTVWDTASGQLLGTANAPDGCGVAAGETPGSLLMTSGRGGAWLWSRLDGKAVPVAGAYLASKQWDNHAVAVTLPA
jgi:hypothetical protein